MLTLEERRAKHAAQAASRKATREWEKNHGGTPSIMSVLKGPETERFKGLSLDTENGVLRGPEGAVAHLDATTRAKVETSGEIDRRLSLTRVTVGAILFGPAGAIVGGLSKRKLDHRAIYVTVSGAGFEWVVQAKAKDEADARAWAATVNGAASAA